MRHPLLVPALLLGLAGLATALPQRVQPLPRPSRPVPGGGDPCLLPTRGNVVDVRLDFGAAGDGVTDDTDALRAAAAYVSRNPGTTLWFPPGRYHVARYAVDWWPDGSLPDLGFGAKTACLFLDASDFTVVGCDATIDVLGSYGKTPGANGWTAQEPRYYARETSFLPFVFLGCSNFEVRGFELDGNADELSVTPGLAWLEQFEAGILTADCSDYRITDVRSHHFPSDGILLGTGVIDERVRVDHVHCHNNARVALGLIQVRDATIEDCTLRDTGDTQGDWPTLSPAVGLGIEPDCSFDPAALNYCPGFPGASGILLQRLRVLDNLGSGVSFAHGDTTADVVLQDSWIRVPDESTAFPLVVGARSSVVQGCDIEAERGPISFLSSADDFSQVSVRLTGNRITGHGLLLYGQQPFGEVLIQGNTITGDFIEELQDASFVILQGAPGTDWQLIDNVVRFPSWAAPLDARYFVAIVDVALMSGNRWEVEAGLPPVPFSIAYSGVLSAADWVDPAIAFEGYEDLLGRIGPDGSIVLP